jgi:hypothetical protein
MFLFFPVVRPCHVAFPPQKCQQNATTILTTVVAGKARLIVGMRRVPCDRLAEMKG